MTVYRLSDTLIGFPPPTLAGKDGLLALGGDLSVERLVLAYRLGIFPWYSEDEPILWWSPDPRLVLFPNELKISGSLKKTIKQKKFTVTMDRSFPEVISSCSEVKRKHENGTWIVDDMIRAYIKLHEAGFAHSVEAWKDGELAGGLYGVSLGGTFFGESMFTRISNASKVAFAHLVSQLTSWSFDMVDCQVTTDHLLRFGAREIPRKRFLHRLEKSLKARTKLGPWSFDNPL